MRLIGRDVELARLRAVVVDGGALVLAGRPGVGKSALIAAAVAGAERVLRVTGVESEIALPFAGLRELLDPVLAEVDALTPVPRGALRAALALDEPAGADRGTVLHAVVNLVAALAPVVVAVDDVQWLDASSCDAIAFLARRAKRRGVAVLIVHALRGEPLDGWPELPTLMLEELGRDAALELARGAGLAPAVAEELVGAVGGNPLALLEGPRELTAAQRAGREALPDVLPAGARLTKSYAARLAQLPARTREALLLVAASSDGATAPLAAALGELAVLDPAEDAGLVVLNQRVVRFCHPEVRAAVYHAVPPSRRRAAHRALAAVLGEHERAWHLAVAAGAPDETLAAALEQSATVAVGRGAPGTALQTLRRAALLTPDPARARERTLAAGHLALVSGRPQTALELASSLPPAVDAGARADTQLLVGAAIAQAGRPTEAHALLEAEAEAIASHDPGRAAGLLTMAAIALMGPGPVARVAQIAARARELAPPGGDLVPIILEAAAHTVAGEHAIARRLLGGRVGEVRVLDAAATDHQVVALAGMCLHWLEDDDGALR